MGQVAGGGREADLAAWYDRDAAGRSTRPIDPERVRRRQEFTDLLLAEGRRRVLEVGTGPGLDAVAFTGAGLDVSGVDLSAAHVALCRAAGVDAHVAPVRALPFADATCDAGWTMSTLLHVPDAELDQALAEIRRVLRPGALLAVGTWCGADVEGPLTLDSFYPPRFFSLRSPARMVELLGRHGEVARSETWPAGDRPDGRYQWVLLRLPGG
ncbi:class I SAM-dependent methyltransferase [Modestobacter roseus]|uniref:Methyltransferase family protein n=1 Tax=Modestobacter roseus TaxID=1181884 RepID=A0A562IUV8_9ACTN|nr:class I SAM-dependent methyltransferase [Modestobacter roseus]MQA35855.1 methyltransferase domain-containing protein [Modestobacter roseus]TWH74304.1 methyltransferase family protein [Modestobacter roseus]